MNINAEFRTLKQLSGITAQHIADKFGVNIRTAQRYETSCTPRPEIMDYMRAIVDDDNQYIEDVLEGAYEVIVEANSRMGYECEPDKVQIPRYLNAYYYYRANGEDAIPYERYTARLNRVISALLVEGYKVKFDYYTTEEG